MNILSDDAIRDRAYALWVEAGSPEGNDLYFWHLAEQQLTAEAESEPAQDDTTSHGPDTATDPARF
tara:strand:+ start:392 stop:589 length:198 start_codon:yes stop_codon:yes gene_type:complete